MIRQIYFIGTGKLSAMFTLNVQRVNDDPSLTRFIPPHYICNLSAAGEENEERAIEKARAYADAMRDRIGETDEFKVEFGGVWEEACIERRGKLSVRDTLALEEIEAGRFPFGKNRGARIEDTDAGYVLFFADKFGSDDNVVTQALAAACQGVALEKGYIAKRDEARAERAAADALSQYVGTIGERREFEGEVVTVMWKDYFSYGERGVNGYWINKVRTDDGNLIAHIGSKKLGERGERVRFKGTIKKHDEYKGVRSTAVSRPAIL